VGKEALPNFKVVTTKRLLKKSLFRFNMDLKNQIRKHRMYLGASATALVLGLATQGVLNFLPQPEKPEIYREFSSAQYQISRLENTRQELGNVLGDEENAIFSGLEEAISKRQERIAEIEKIPEFQEYQGDYKKFKAKKDVAWYGSMGLLVAGYIGSLRSLSRASKIRREYEAQKEVKSE
jgi:hypothetical protein